MAAMGVICHLDHINRLPSLLPQSLCDARAVDCRRCRYSSDYCVGTSSASLAFLSFLFTEP